MKKAKLVQAMFTQEEIAAINTKNIKLEEENERLQSSLDYANRDREDMHNKIIELWNKRESQRNMNYKLRKENKELKIIIENNELEQKADWKYIEELEDKYEKLKADYIKLSKIVEVGWGYRASYVNELRDKIAKLEQELDIWI